MSSPLPQSEMTINDCSNSSLKQLVRVLRGVPSFHSLKNLTYNSSIKKSIKTLPIHLQQASTPSRYGLCATHSGLNDALIDDIWYCIGTELSTVLGTFIHPLLLAHKLTSAQEGAVRQLEPVGEMFDKAFSWLNVTPAHHAPIDAGKKWAHQADECMACMLARIGSDEKVLLALYAGMLGHFPTYKLAHRRIKHEDLTPEALDKPKSKRVRFVRYWLKACTDGGALVYQAAELGIVLKKANKALKAERKAAKKEAKQQTWSQGGESVSVDSTANPSGDEHRTDTSQRNVPHGKRTSNPFADPKLGPLPRAADLNPHSPAEALGFNVPPPRAPRHHRRNSHDSQRGLLDAESDLESESEIEEYDGPLPNDSVSMAPSGTHYPEEFLSTPVPPMPNPFRRDRGVPEPLHPRDRAESSRRDRGSHRARAESVTSRHDDQGPFRDSGRRHGGRQRRTDVSGAQTEWGDLY